MHFKGGQTLKNLMVPPRIRTQLPRKAVSSTCLDKIDCEDEFIGDSFKTFGERYKEHLKAPSPIFVHQNTTGHPTSVENFRIMGREGPNIARAFKEALRVSNLSIGKERGTEVGGDVLDKGMSARGC